MKNRDKIIYWVATLWLSLGMVSAALAQIFEVEEVVENLTQFGYPVYFLKIIGVWKILGVIAILLPRFPLLKEWAYAGFFFLVTGAVLTHLSAGDEPSQFIGPSLLIILTIISWYFRPSNRKIQA